MYTNIYIIYINTYTNINICTNRYIRCRYIWIEIKPVYSLSVLPEVNCIFRPYRDVGKEWRKNERKRKKKKRKRKREKSTGLGKANFFQTFSLHGRFHSKYCSLKVSVNANEGETGTSGYKSILCSSKSSSGTCVVFNQVEQSRY